MTTDRAAQDYRDRLPSHFNRLLGRSADLLVAQQMALSLAIPSPRPLSNSIHCSLALRLSPPPPHTLPLTLCPVMGRRCWSGDQLTVTAHHCSSAAEWAKTQSAVNRCGRKLEVSERRFSSSGP